MNGRSGKTSSQKRDVISSSGRGSVRSFVDGLLKQRKESTEPGSVDINAIRKQMQRLEPSEIKRISEFAQKIQQGKQADGKSSGK